MSERVPIQQAIAEAEERVVVLYDDNLNLIDREAHVASGHNAGHVIALKAVESGEIVTAERAALEAMAEQPCQDISGELCEITMPGDPVHWCHPCGCRHALEATA